jgi:hypothetical protein
MVSVHILYVEIRPYGSLCITYFHCFPTIIIYRFILKMNSQILEYLLRLILEMASKGNHTLISPIFETLCSSIQLAYIEMYLVLLCIRPCENFNFPITTFPVFSLFSSKSTKTPLYL